MKRATNTAIIIHEHFRTFLGEFQRLGNRAIDRFMARDWRRKDEEATRRLSLYETQVRRIVSLLLTPAGPDMRDRRLWINTKSAFTEISSEHEETQIARTFFNSVSRRVFATIGVDTDVEFTFRDPFAGDNGDTREDFSELTFPPADIETVLSEMIRMAGLPMSAFADAAADLHRAAQRINDTIADIGTFPERFTLKVMRSALYRGNRAFVIGCLDDGHHRIPLVLALEHPERGIAIDAVILDEIGMLILFSFTRSHFLGRLRHTPAVVNFLHSLMPDKREAEIYISLGHHKHGKTLLYRDLTDHQTCTEDQFGVSPGTPGMVMVAFNMRLDNMVFKVIRDRFETPKRTSNAQIKEKYDLVFRHDRAGRLVDAQEFEALQFDRCCFTDELLDILTREASATVEVNGDNVLLKHVYVQRRVTPLDLFLRKAAPAAAAAAVRDLGKAIKDLMAVNIFPGDILLKNFGVTRHGRVVFYDYDEICHVTDCRFRKQPPPRDDMDMFQDEPWFLVEENDVFPEEFIRFMGLSEPLRKEFIAHHLDLLTPDLWQRLHHDLSAGKTYYVRPYADTYRLT